MRIADTHTHLYFQSFDRDRSKVIQQNKASGIALEIQIGVDEVSSMAALDLAQKNDHMYCTLGVHPCDVDRCFSPVSAYIPTNFKPYTLQAKNFDELFTLFEAVTIKNPEKVVGFGETGFDLYHRNTPELFHLQKEIFLRHITLAQKYQKPIIVHGRNSHQEMLDFFDQKVSPGSVRGVIHCFSEGIEYAKYMTQNYGFLLGIGGIATYPKAQNVRLAIAETPIEFLITETDSPFLPPQKKKSYYKRNQSSFLPEVIELIARIKNIPLDECGEILFENAQRFFLSGFSQI
jgi:TatD DNase family protein